MSFEFQESLQQPDSTHSEQSTSLFHEAYEAAAQRLSTAADWIVRTAEGALGEIESFLFVDDDDDFDPKSGDRIDARYGFGEDGSEVTVNDDGSRVTVMSDGQKITELPDGSVKVEQK